MKKIKKFLLGRATVMLLGVMLQLGWILLFIQRYSMRYSFIGTLIDVVALYIALVIVNKNSNPSYKASFDILSQQPANVYHPPSLF